MFFYFPLPSGGLNKGPYKVCGRSCLHDIFLLSPHPKLSPMPPPGSHSPYAHSPPVALHRGPFFTYLSAHQTLNP